MTSSPAWPASAGTTSTGITVERYHRPVTPSRLPEQVRVTVVARVLADHVHVHYAQAIGLTTDVEGVVEAHARDRFVGAAPCGAQPSRIGRSSPVSGPSAGLGVGAVQVMRSAWQV
jgi:hypothetical protein